MVVRMRESQGRTGRGALPGQASRLHGRGSLSQRRLEGALSFALPLPLSLALPVAVRGPRRRWGRGAGPERRQRGALVAGRRRHPLRALRQVVLALQLDLHRVPLLELAAHVFARVTHAAVGVAQELTDRHLETDDHL